MSEYPSTLGRHEGMTDSLANLTTAARASSSGKKPTEKKKQTKSSTTSSRNSSSSTTKTKQRSKILTVEEVPPFLLSPKQQEQVETPGGGGGGGGGSSTKHKTKKMTTSTKKKSARKKPSLSVAPNTPKTTLGEQKTDQKGTTDNNNNKATPVPNTPGDRTVKSTPGKSSKTYLIMVHEAIGALKDRSGSSMIAISKYVLAEHPNLFGPHFKSRMSLAIKSGIKQNRFIKVRASFKINSDWTKKEKAKQRAKDFASKKKNKKKTQAQEDQKKEAQLKKRRDDRERKLKEKKKTMSEEELEALRVKQAKLKLIQQRKEEAIKRQKEILERIRKRRFPMEDTSMHKEDKELGVKPPPDCKRRPPLPYFGMAVLDDTRTSTNSTSTTKTPTAVVTATKCEQLHHGSRGLVVDLMQVFHFFKGDVAFRSKDLMPEFNMKHLMYAVEEIQNGNAKKARMVPPLICHLFVSALRLILIDNTDIDATNEYNSVPTNKERQRAQDFDKLANGLGPASWGEICFQYMDAMERYYVSEASEDPNVLAGRCIDMEYLMRASNVCMTPSKTTASQPKKLKSSNGEITKACLPEGYHGYLGDHKSSLSRAHAKLESKDPWNLMAEELFALLRALTDDILGGKDEISNDIAQRDEEMHELLRAKRSAVSQCRKKRLAFEGPKKPTRKAPVAAEPPKSSDNKTEKIEKTDCENKTSDDEADPSEDVHKKEDDKENVEKESTPEQEEAPKFKPTATKKEYETAMKTQQKAIEAYEKGLRKLVSRREPIGRDRNFNKFYFFNHDPEMIYVEVFKAANNGYQDDAFPVEMQMKKSNWHIIETKRLFEQYTASLDIRGIRENELYEELVGPSSGSSSLKRFMFDDMKEQNALNAMKREQDELDRRLNNARLACAAEEAEGGRRSGRLSSRAQLDFIQVTEEIETLECRMKNHSEPILPNYEELTGLEELRKFDKVNRRETRRTREQKAVAEAKNLPKMPCSTLCCTGNIDGTGTVGLVLTDMLQVEEVCQSLSPWGRTDVNRKLWITNLEEAAYAWNSGSPLLLGPSSTREVGTPASIGTPASKVIDEEVKGAITPSTPDVGTKRMSIDGARTMSDSKRVKLDMMSPMSNTSAANQSISQIITMLKTPILELEQRVFEISGYARATKDADDADDNMSVGSSESDVNQREEGNKELEWKKKIHSLRSTPTARYGQIREILVDAIAAARKAHLSEVVAALRAALLLHHPQAAGECKSMAISLLDKYGGYDEDDDDDSDDESESDEAEQNEANKDDDVPSILSGEAMMINGSVKGDENANRVDWIDAVNDCKTMSRFAALANAFLRNALNSLKKIKFESETLHRALTVWEKEEERKKRTRGGKASQKTTEVVFDSSVEVWADVRTTNDFCMAKLDVFPAWPAKKCEAKDPTLSKSLLSANRILVSLTGEDGGIRVVPMTDITPYTGKALEEDLSEYKKEVRTQLDECLAMARRIVRGIKKQSGAKGTGFVEEKKSAI